MTRGNYLANMKDIKINVIKSWRKSLSMRFDREGVLQVKAPKFMMHGQIEQFLKNHQDWIEKEYEKIKEREKDKKDYLFGEEVSISSQREDFYKSQAKKYIIPRCNYLAEKHGFSHKGIRITSASSRWGSCSSKKTLNFSYRLIMSPRDCIDYVIIHELCHLRQMNHSQKFWSEVASIMPEYKKYEQHLKSEGWRYRV